jgi:hypothetical protein
MHKLHVVVTLTSSNATMQQQHHASALPRQQHQGHQQQHSMPANDSCAAATAIQGTKARAAAALHADC